MRAAVCHAVGRPLDIREVDLRAPGPDEVLVKIAATGVCASDLHILDGSLPKPLPIVPGHEAAGHVVALGDGVDGPAVGDHVVLTILPWCGACAVCRDGRRRMCTWAARLATTGTIDGYSTALTIDGAPLHHFTGVSSWAQYAVVPRTGAVPITAALPSSQAALLGCAVATGFGAVRNAASVQPGQSVAVIGCGGVGLTVVQAAARAGASPLIALDRNPRAVDIAEGLGASHALVVGDEAADRLIHQVTPHGVDHCFEVLGRPATVEAAWRATAAGGQTTVVGLLPSRSTVTLDAFPLITEKRLVGTYLGGTRPDTDLPALANAAVRNEISLAPLITEIGLDDLPAAVEALRRGAVTARLVVRLD